MNKYWAWGTTLLVILGAIAELGLRFGVGLGNPVLLQTDPEIGYYFQPNQDKTRFGHHLHYNQFAQRSEAIAQPKPELRILMTGDSVLNGGNLIDQPDTITEQVEVALQNHASDVEVLNASAGSWAIGNQWAYLQKFGAFESDLLILQIGTHDLIQSTSTGEHIGREPHFPNRKPLLAVQEAWTRYVWPTPIMQPLRQHFSSPPVPQPSQPQRTLSEQFADNLATLDAILNWAEQQNLPLWIVYTPDRADVLIPEGYPANYQPLFKAEFVAWARSRSVPLIDIHETWLSLPTATTATYFRDTVHLTPAGNRAVAEQIAKQVEAASDL